MGWARIEAGLSDFYLVDEIQGTYRGMMIGIPPPHWQSFGSSSLVEIAQVLQDLAAKVNLKRFLKTPRGPKKKRESVIVDPKHLHVSTARLEDSPSNC